MYKFSSAVLKLMSDTGKQGYLLSDVSILVDEVFVALLIYCLSPLIFYCCTFVLCETELSVEVFMDCLSTVTLYC